LFRTLRAILRFVWSTTSDGQHRQEPLTTTTTAMRGFYETKKKMMSCSPLIIACGRRHDWKIRRNCRLRISDGENL